MATKTDLASQTSSKLGALNRSDVLSLIGVFVVIAFAFFLRVFLLNGQSLWYDEGISMVMAPRDLATITANASADIHPPLYYYILHFWTTMVGTSEFGGRFLSVIYGVLLIPLLFQIGRILFSRQVGVAAAFFAAIAPFLVYYSQEARMYMQVTFLGALSTCLYMMLILEKNDRTKNVRRWMWIGYWLASTMALYSHYFGFAILLFQNIHFWLLSGQQKRSWQPWLISQVAMALAFIPWLTITISQFGTWPSISESFSFDKLIRDAFLVFTFGLSWDATATQSRELIPIILLAISFVYVVLLRRKSSWQNIALIALYTLVPILLLYVLSIRRPMYNPKFLLVATPAYYCLLGLGAIGLGKICQAVLAKVGVSRTSVISGIIAAIVIITPIAGVSYAEYFSLQAYYFDPKYQRDDYRGLAQYVSERTRPGDVIVLNAPGQVEILDYYYQGQAQRVPLPAQRPIDESQTRQQLAELAAKNQRIWLVLWAVPESDPNGVIEGWLDQHTFKGLNNWFGKIRLCLYTTSQTTDLVEQSTTTRFGDSISLASYAFETAPTVPGESIPLTFKWNCAQQLKDNYSVFVHVLDANNLIVGQRDSQPSGGARPTTTWAVGETIEDRYAVPIQQGTPPGTYQIEIGLYDSVTGQRLPVKDSTGKNVDNRLVFGPVLIDHANANPETSLLGIKRASTALFDGRLRLLGYNLEPLGRSSEGMTDGMTLKSSDILHTSLFWNPNSIPLGNFYVELQLRKPSDKTIAKTVKNAPASGMYASQDWHRDEIIRDQHKVPLTGLAGDYIVLLALHSNTTNELWKLEQTPTMDGYLQLGTITVTP